MQRFRFKVFKQYLWLALFVILLRVAFRLVFDRFSVDNLIVSAFEGMKLSLWVLGFGLLNSLIDFRKVLPKSPRFLKTITTALNISLALTPEIVRSLERIKSAVKLRAHRRGFHLIRSLVVPAISNAIDQAINLGDSMSSRGYGRSETKTPTSGAIELPAITFAYHGESPVLKNVRISFPPGSLVLITGRTGSGKSTLLRVIQARKPRCAFVNQFPREGFVASTVYDELAFALVQEQMSRREIGAKVSAMANRFGLQDSLEADPQTLSAGFQQRVAIASNLISDAKVLLLDEPFSALDEPSSRILLESLAMLKDQGVTIVIAEHRFDSVTKIADLRFSLENGSLSAYEKAPRNLVREGNSTGSITALFGANGSGKTTHLRKLASQRGVLVPQPASDLLFLNSVSEELAMADSDSKQSKGTAAAIFHDLVGAPPGTQNPRDLSQGQKLALAISIQLCKNTELLMLDEPTLGFDLDAKESLIRRLRKLSASGTEVIVATHDREFAEAVATRTEFIKDGVITHV